MFAPTTTAAPSARANAKTKSRIPSAAQELREGIIQLRPELLGRAMRMTGSKDLAEDLAQDTVERAMQFQRQYKQGTNLRAWVHQILFTVFMTRCRRARRERNALSTLATDPCAWTRPEELPQMQRLSPPVEKALNELPKGFRRAVILVDIEEMSYRAAAKRMRVPVGTVMSRLYRARRALADAMRGTETLLEAA
jgi:RNA polymerase sigma-70 factor (ECF subfamily)